MNLWDVSRYIWTKSPQDYWRRLVPVGDSVDGAVWTTGKHRQWNRLPYYLHAFREVAERYGHALQFPGCNVLEFGPGPVLGFAPLVLAEGATAVTLVDPAYEDLRDNPRFQSEYLFPLYCTHSRLTRDSVSLDFDTFLSSVQRIQVCVCCGEQFQSPAAQFDRVLSKSCLEYCVDLDRVVDICQEASAAGSLHCHYIDFSLHRLAHRVGSPFGSAYEHSRESNPEFFQNRGGDLNLLRPSDMVTAFRRKFKEVHFFPLSDYQGRVSLDRIHPDWARYPVEELTVANGVLLAVK